MTILHIKPTVSPVVIENHMELVTIIDLSMTLLEYLDQNGNKNQSIKNYYPNDRSGVSLRLPNKLGRYAILDFAILCGLIKCPNDTTIENFNSFSKWQRELILNMNAWYNNYYYTTDNPEDSIYIRDPEGRLILGGHDQAPEIDHIFPRSSGGCNAFGNAQVISGAFNNRKRNGLTDDDEKKSEEYANESRKRLRSR